jgi:hypothetical protein
MKDASVRNQVSIGLSYWPASLYVALLPNSRLGSWNRFLAPYRVLSFRLRMCDGSIYTKLSLRIMSQGPSTICTRKILKSMQLLYVQCLQCLCNLRPWPLATKPSTYISVMKILNPP